MVPSWLFKVDGFGSLECTTSDVQQKSNKRSTFSSADEWKSTRISQPDRMSQALRYNSHVKYRRTGMKVLT